MPRAESVSFRPAPAELPIGRFQRLIYRVLGGNLETQQEKYRQAIDEHLAVTGEWPLLKYVGDSLLFDEGD